MFNIKNLIVSDVEDLANEENFIGVKVALPNLNLGHGATSNVAALELQFGRQGILGHAPGFSYYSDILANFVLNVLIHNITILHLYLNNILDIIVME